MKATKKDRVGKKLREMRLGKGVSLRPLLKRQVVFDTVVSVQKQLISWSMEKILFVPAIFMGGKNERTKKCKVKEIWFFFSFFFSLNESDRLVWVQLFVSLNWLSGLEPIF